LIVGWRHRNHGDVRHWAAVISRLPIWALVGAKGFRFPLELVMHRAASAGVMPPE